MALSISPEYPWKTEFHEIGEEERGALWCSGKPVRVCDELGLKKPQANSGTRYR